MSQQHRAPRVLFPFDYDGITYAAATVPTTASQVLHMPDGTFLEPTSWIHSSPRPRIGFAHVFKEARAGAEVVEVWELVETAAP
jgi:hypothetical protein